MHENYESELSAAAVLFGFTVDSLTLRRIDLWAEHVVILSYILIAAVAILLMHLHNEGKLKRWQIFNQADWWVPLVMQFAFGGLFSVFLVFYGRAGSLSANWLFLLMLVGFLIGNEFFRRRYRRLTFNITVWYTAVLAYCIFAIPILVNQIGGWVFILSGIISLVIVGGFVYGVSLISPQSLRLYRNTVIAGISAVFALTTILYFSHAIPPIPLSLQEVQVAYSVDRNSSGNYQLTVPDKPFYKALLPRKRVSVASGKPVYFYSSVFAPAQFNTRITHNWQHYENGQWQSKSRISYPLIGGRSGGYRGYSLKRSITEGKWRVSVETDNGRLIGQETFRINFTEQPLDRERVIR